MLHHHFNPVHVEHPGGCYTCRHFLGRYNGEALLCDDTRYVHCPSLPASGCAFWQREPSGDDEGRQEHVR